MLNATLKTLAATAFLSGLMASVNAENYQYDVNSPLGSARAGDLTSLSLNYSDTDDALSGSFTFQETSRGQVADTGWMVLSHGPNPKGNEEDYGILYMDFINRDSWLYQYNGQNDPSSYANSPLLAYYNDSLNVARANNAMSVDFAVDFTNIQAPTNADNWTGMSFGQHVGVWFHGLLGQIRGDENGISHIRGSGRAQSWYDTSNQRTHTVPEIDAAGLPLIATLMLAMIAVGRERFSKH